MMASSIAALNPGARRALSSTSKQTWTSAVNHLHYVLFGTKFSLLWRSCCSLGD
jgi:hypothetical protein